MLLYVHDDLVNAIQNFFSTGYMPKAFNETLVTLIPKIDTPSNLTHFRPISLCNMVYKIISKVLMNRVKPLLGTCISHSQVAFVLGRQIVDNIIIAHEYIYWLNNKRYGKDAFMALKIDMSKAYDRVE